MIPPAKKTAITLLLAVTIGVAPGITLAPEQDDGTVVYLAGDSTMAAQTNARRPATGWGELLNALLCDNVSMVNYAKNGRSTKSFLSEGIWKKLLARVKPGDVVLIQFGHNDQKADDPALFAAANDQYTQNLHRLATDVLDRRAQPVLLTSIVRRNFNHDGKLVATLGNYPAAMRQVAEKLSIPLVDLNAQSYELVQKLGPISSRSLYLHLPAGVQPNYRRGIQDDTHLNHDGAVAVAALAALELEKILPDVFCPP